MKHRFDLVCLFPLLLLLSFPLAAQKKERPEPVNIQTFAAASHAVAGGNGYAAISVLVTAERGELIADLGDSVGDGTTPIELPAGWALWTPHVAPGGCSLSPVAFLKGGFDQHPGAYLIIAVPWVPNPACSWVSGEFHYVVRIDTSTPENPGLQGTGLGKLVVP